MFTILTSCGKCKYITLIQFEQLRELVIYRYYGLSRVYLCNNDVVFIKMSFEASKICVAIEI